MSEIDQQDQQAQDPLLSGEPAEEQTGEQTQQTEQTQPEQQQAAPEEYTPFEVPEGTEPIDDATHQELASLGKDLGLTQDQLQKIVTYGAKKIGDGMEAVRLEILKKRQDWRTASEKDPEITNGIDHAKRLVTSVGDEKFKSEFKEMMDETGIGDNPTFIRFCIQAGKLLGEDSFVRSEKKSAGEQQESLLSMARSLYPDMK